MIIPLFIFQPLSPSTGTDLELTAIRTYVGTSPVSMYDNCVQINPFGSPTFALTTTRLGSGDVKKYASHISLCPPALARAQQALYADVASIPQGFAERVTAWLSRNRQQPIAIDTMYLFESGILHEVSLYVTQL